VLGGGTGGAGFWDGLRILNFDVSTDPPLCREDLTFSLQYVTQEKEVEVKCTVQSASSAQSVLSVLRILEPGQPCTPHALPSR
jgi:hypothetical protein